MTFRKFNKMLLVVALLFLHRKQFLMKFSFESLPTYEKQLWGLMLAKRTPIRCFHPCPPVFIRVGISMSQQVDSHLDKNKSRTFEKMVMSYFQQTRPDCKNESFNTTVTQKEIDCCIVDSFFSHCNAVFEATGCLYHLCPCQAVRTSLTE